jgi:hypothetical protein
MPVRLSVGMEPIGSHWTDFDEVLYLSVFRKSVAKIQVSLKSSMNTITHFLLYLTNFFLEWEMFRTKVEEKIKTHILCLFFRKLYSLWENVETCAAGDTIYGTYTLQFGNQRLQTYTQNM